MFLLDTVDQNWLQVHGMVHAQHVLLFLTSQGSSGLYTFQVCKKVLLTVVFENTIYLISTLSQSSIWRIIQFKSNEYEEGKVCIPDWEIKRKPLFWWDCIYLNEETILNFAFMYTKIYANLGTFVHFLFMLFLYLALH